MKQLRSWIILILFALSLAACGSTAQPAETPAPENQPGGFVAEGRLLPIQVVDLAFTAPGRVAEILVTEGEAVQAGQVIARLELVNPELRQLDLARARLELLNAEQALAALQDRLPLALSQARMDVADLELQIQGTNDKLAEEQDKDEKDELLIAWYQASLAVLEERLADAQSRVQTLQAGPDPDELAAAQARLAAAQAALASAEAGLQPVELKAPWAGTLTGLNLLPGQAVTAGLPVATLADFSSWVVKTDNLTEIEVVRLAVGQSVTLVFDAIPGEEITGKITGIRQQFEEKRGDITYTVTIEPTNLNPAARWGMTAVIAFEN